MNHVRRIAEELEPQLPTGKEVGAEEQSIEGGRLLIGPRGVQLTKRDGSTVQIAADSIVVQMPNGKLVKFEALMSQHGPFDRQ